MACTGRGEPNGDHCCYLQGQPCPFLTAGTEGRAWDCSLRRELGSWARVHADKRYRERVQPVWDRLPGRPIWSCGDWQPGPMMCCNKDR